MNSPKKKPLGIYLLAGTVIASNLLLIFWYYAVPAEVQKQVPAILRTFFPIIAVFPQEVFEGYLREFVEMRLFWFLTMLLCAAGILFLNKLSRSVFIVFNIIHIVTLTYIVATKLGQTEFIDYFFKLYFNMVAVLTYVGFLTILEVREHFHLDTRESPFMLWFKKLNLVSPGAGNVGAYYNLGLAYSRLERYDDAIDLLTKAAKINPNEADVHFQLGLIYLKQRKYHEAVIPFKEAIRINPFHHEAYANIGLAYKQEGCVPEAIRSFEKANHLKPGSAPVYRSLGESYNSMGQYQQAIQAFQEAVRLNPHDESAYYQMGAIYLNHLDQLTEAREALQKAIRLNPHASADVHFQAGMAAVKLNLPKDAIRAFKEVIRLDPNHKQGHYQLGFAYAVIGDAASAARQYQNLTELDPDLANSLKMVIKQ